MKPIYVVLANGEVDSAFSSSEKAGIKVAELCRFECDSVQYDEHGFAQSESGAVKMFEIYLQG